MTSFVCGYYSGEMKMEGKWIANPLSMDYVPHEDT